jgi:hypothetical protein
LPLVPFAVHQQYSHTAIYIAQSQDGIEKLKEEADSRIRFVFLPDFPEETEIMDEPDFPEEPDHLDL